jgi:succinate-acetate transporter protein
LGVVFGGLALLAVLGIGVGASAIGVAAYGSMGVYWVSMAILAIMVVLEGLAISL